jgi:hypothetical protein
MARSRLDPGYGPDDLKAELCRHLDAARRGGFDGDEHPEHMETVETVLRALYPLHETAVAALVSGRAIASPLDPACGFQGEGPGSGEAQEPAGP